MDKHKKRVDTLSAQVKDFYRTQTPFKIYHGSTNSTRKQVFKRAETLDTSRLNHVLSVDTKKQVAIVEPNVPMDKLVKATLKHGLIPPVVMEFPGITVGGAVQGGAGESSSFKYGGFHDICNAYEMIVGDGTVLNCSETQHADLFYGTAGSYGTLGVMTQIELNLIPAKRYVNLTYTPVHSYDDALATLDAQSNNANDYVDGIQFAANRGVVVAGKLGDKKIGSVRRFSRPWDDWFYLRAEKIDPNEAAVSESVPLVDYLFRYDRGGFWVGKYAFDILGMPFNRFWRMALNRMLHTRKMYEAIQASGMSQRIIVQDLATPNNMASEFMSFIDTNFAIYPLWLCPLSLDNRSPFICSNLQSPKVMNIGVWGNHINSHDDFIAANRLIEQTVTELGGRKWFYAHTYYEEDEFWRIYDRDAYERLRAKYHTGYLPSTFDKVRVKEKYDINIHKGVWRPFFRLGKLRIDP